MSKQNYRVMIVSTAASTSCTPDQELSRHSSRDAAEARARRYDTGTYAFGVRVEWRHPTATASQWQRMEAQ